MSGLLTVGSSHAASNTSFLCVCTSQETPQNKEKNTRKCRVAQPREQSRGKRQSPDPRLAARREGRPLRRLRSGGETQTPTLRAESPVPARPPARWRAERAESPRPPRHTEATSASQARPQACGREGRVRAAVWAPSSQLRGCVSDRASRPSRPRALLARVPRTSSLCAPTTSGWGRAPAKPGPSLRRKLKADV